VIVFLDMDGVLVDFVGAVASLFGCPRSEVESSGDRAYEAAGVTKQEFWGVIDAAGPEWWEFIEPYPWTGRLIEACSRAGQVYVASSPPKKCFGAGSGKMAWLSRFAPQVYKDRKFFLGTDKYLLAAPGRVLVDDDPEKCAAFAAAGGQTALFPQPWNIGGLPAGATPEKLIEGIELRGEFDGHLR